MTSYSFNDLVYSDWSSVVGKMYSRTDTGERLGEIYSKYPKESGKISASMGDGIIDFLDRTKGNGVFTKIAGVNIDPNAKLFSVLDEQE